MKTWQMTAPRRMQPADEPAPAIAHDDDALVRVAAVGVCGSDMHYYKEGSLGDQVPVFPFRLGHECAGTVVDAGPKARHLIGTPVAVDPAVSCAECDQCRAGRGNTCRKLQFLSCPGQLPGCLAELIVVPARNLFPVGDLDLAHAVVAEPLAVGLYAVKRARIAAGARVGILGAGPVGLCVLAALQEAGAAATLVSEPLGWRTDAASALGATWAGTPEEVEAAVKEREPLGLDVVFECAGEPDALDQALRIVKPGGKLVMVGIPESLRVSFPVHVLRRLEVDIIAVRRQEGCTDRAVELLQRRPGLAAAVVSHLLPWEEAADAFELVEKRGDRVIKAIIAGK